LDLYNNRLRLLYHNDFKKQISGSGGKVSPHCREKPINFMLFRLHFGGKKFMAIFIQEKLDFS
jgi:hypothetical protein